MQHVCHTDKTLKPMRLGNSRSAVLMVLLYIQKQVHVRRKSNNTLTSCSDGSACATAAYFLGLGEAAGAAPTFTVAKPFCTHLMAALGLLPACEAGELHCVYWDCA